MEGLRDANEEVDDETDCCVAGSYETRDSGG